jgi:hypothetical protein
MASIANSPLSDPRRLLRRPTAQVKRPYGSYLERLGGWPNRLPVGLGACLRHASTDHVWPFTSRH